MTERQNTDKFEELRKKAEHRLGGREKPIDRLSRAEALEAVHELHVHQVELDMQNEELRRAQVELKLSEQKYSDLFHFAPIGYFVLDREGNIAEVNVAGASMVGVERNAMAAQPLVLCIDKADRDRYYQSCAEVFQKGRRKRCDVTMLRKGGDTFYAELLLEPVKDAEGKLISCRVGVIDITARVKAEEVVLRAKRLGETLNIISETLHSTLDRNLIMERLLREGTEALGAGSGAISLRRSGGWEIMYAIGLPEGTVGSRASDQQKRHAVLAIESGSPVTIEDAFNDRRVNQAHLRHYGIRAVLVAPLRLRDESPGAIFFNYHDGPHEFNEAEVSFARQLAATASIALENARLFDEHKKTEQALSRSEEKFHGLFDTMDEAFVLFELIRDASGKVVDCRVIEANQATEQMTGIAPSDAVGRTLLDMFPDTDPFWFETYDRVEATGEPTVVERRFKPLKRYFRTCIYRPAAGQIAIIFMDITDRREAEQTLRKSNAELEGFNRAMVGRELRMIELKKQVNELNKRLGQPPCYPLEFVKDEPDQ